MAAALATIRFESTLQQNALPINCRRVMLLTRMRRQTIHEQIGIQATKYGNEGIFRPLKNKGVTHASRNRLHRKSGATRRAGCPPPRNRAREECRTSRLHAAR